MDVRKSFSRLKKKLEHPWSKRKPDRTGADSDRESFDSAGPPPRPVSHVVAGGGHDREDGVNAEGQQIHPTDKLLSPGVAEPAQVHGGDEDQEEGEGSIDGRESSQRHSHLCSDIKVVTGGGPGREENGVDGEKVGRVYPSQPTLSIPRGGKPNGV